LASYHPSQPIKPWISAIIRYKVADYFRQLSRKKEQYFKYSDIDVTNIADETNKYEESSNDILEILNGLTVKYRRAIELTHISGLSYLEAAKKEKISEVALRKRISRGFSQIRKIVSKDMEIVIGEV
jgi:RNA polymerase sigma-70 factor, ECF subfamily